MDEVDVLRLLGGVEGEIGVSVAVRNSDVWIGCGVGIRRRGFGLEREAQGAAAGVFAVIEERLDIRATISRSIAVGVSGAIVGVLYNGNGCAVRYNVVHLGGRPADRHSEPR